MWCKMFILISCFFFTMVECNLDIADRFSRCDLTSTDIDICLKDAFNDMRSFFKEGLPEYGVGSFDPFYIDEIVQRRRFPFARYKLTLKNVTESGWTTSLVTGVRTDFPNNEIHVTQFFPDKRLDGWYEIEGTFFGQEVHNRGSWNLSLFDYSQTLTISRKPGEDFETEEPAIKVKCSIKTCRKLNLHIDHLAGGRTIVENMLGWIINTAWQPGFVILSPLINDLVGTAFSEVFDDYFREFPFDSVFTKSSN